ncbi:MAG: TolC family protein [Nitrospirae bacterium]|nr:TolC family protein [Nitrospirota bacterium]
MKKSHAGAYCNTPLQAGLVLLFFLFLSGPASVSAQDTARPMTLDEANRLALERNLGLKSARAEVLSARALTQSQFTDFFPKLSAEARYSRAGDLQRIQIPAGAFNASPPFPPVDADVTTGALTNYNLRLTLEQPLFTGGSIYYAYESAQLGYRSADFGFQEAIQDLLLRVELAYWDILKTERLQAVSELQVSDLKEHLRAVKASYNAGSVPYNEVLKTTVNLAEAEQRFLTARNNAGLAKMAMNNLLRQDLASPMTVSDPKADDPTELPAYEEALKTAQSRRLELAAGRTQVEAMHLRESLARSDYYPKLSAIAHYDRAKETTTILPENWEVLGVLRWTFWEWGRTGHEVERAGIRLRQSEDDLRSLEDRIALEVREQHLRAQEMKEKIAVAKTAVEQAEENYRITEERFKSGVTTNTEVLDAESLLVSARANHTNAVYDFLSSRARLARAMGLLTGPKNNPGVEVRP